MKFFMFCLLGMGWALNALAEDKSVGCGLGEMVAPKKTMVSATTRAGVNYVLPNTFSMTSGTSGCAAHTLVKIEKRAIHYTEVNYDSLEMEMAQGQGEFLNGLASVLGCEQNAFGQATQLNYGKIVPQNERSPIKLLDSVHELIRTSPDLAKACQSQWT
jgi:hypothetical protein